MANNVVELIVKVVDSATAPLRNIENAVDHLSRELTGVGVGSLAGIAGIGLALHKVLEESEQAQLAAVRFNAAFAAMGKTVGVTSEEMEKFARAAQDATRFSDENVKEAQTTLLRFADVTGDVFRQAQHLALDLAEAMGGDASGAAQLLGRALENPIQSMRLLRQVGVYFTDSQKEQIKTLIETGHQQQAQKIVLDELTKRYGGLAEKVGGTVVGSIAKLQHAFDDLFKVQDQAGPLTDSLNELTAVFKDPEVISSIHTVFGAMLDGLAEVVGLLAKAITGWKLIFGLFETTEIQDKSAELVRAQQRVNESLLAHENTSGAAGAKERYARLTADVVRLRKELEALTRAQQLSELTEVKLKSQVLGTGGQRGFNNSTQHDRDTIAESIKKAAEDQAQAVKDANTATMTDIEKTVTAYNLFLQQIALLSHTSIAQGGIDTAEAVKRTVEETNKILEEVQLKSVHIYDKPTKAVEVYSKAQLQAISGIQNAFVDMFHHVDEGIGGMLSAFLDALKEMVIQALAAKLTESLFGSVDEKTGERSGGTNWGAALLDIGASLFGFASGGDAPGGLKLVGENGPELMSSGPGRIWNNQQLMAAMGSGGGGNGGITFAPATTINVQGSMDSVTEGRIYQYIEATRTKDQREMTRLLQRNGMRNIR